MKIAEFEKKSKLSRDTVRYYEKIGLLIPPVRGQNSYREYTENHLKEVLFIKRSQEIGFSLKHIKRGLESLRSKGRLCGEFKQELARQRELFEEKIKESREAIKQIDKLMRKE